MEHNGRNVIWSIALAAFFFAPSPTLAQTCILTVNPEVLPDGQLNVRYSQVITRSGNYASPVYYRVKSGAPPTGLDLNQTYNTASTISGIPTAVGTFTFTIAAASAFGGCSGERTYTVNIAAAVPATSTWVTIVLGVLLALIGIASIRKQDPRLGEGHIARPNCAK